MKSVLKKILAVLMVILLVFGWYAMVKGIGGSKPLKDKIQLGLDIKGGVYVVMEAKTDKTGDELTSLMNQTKEVINKRVDSLGVSNAEVRIEGKKRIRVELPGAENAEEAIKQIGKTAQLQFVMADGGYILDGSQVKKAEMSTGSEGGYVVNLQFKSEGATAFEKATQKALEGNITPTVKTTSGVTVNAKSIVIKLDDTVISYPVVNSVISGGKCEISGSFTKEEASELAALINGGALPAPLEEVTSSVQSAKIGYEALDSSILAGIIGIGLVFLIMLVGYRIMGLVADIALAIYVLLVLLIMMGMGNVITLPGIAGLILSIGMAVDANVVIFTRIKEEISTGKSPRVAVQSGFKRAMSTVIDSQVTTLIAAIILYEIGSTSVKGFALTLLIGIIVGLVTAVLIAQLYLSLFANSKLFNKNKWFGVKEDGTFTFAVKKKFHFIKNRKIYYCISIAIIVIGLGFGVFRGFNYGIDFTGGTMIQIDMGEKVAMSKVESILDKEKIDAEIVYAGDDNNEIIIRTVQSLDNEARNKLIGELQDEFKFENKDILGQELFGPTVGKELKTNAIKAVLLAAVGMLIYIRIRFKKWRFGAASLLGVLHDVLVVIAFYAIFNVTVNNPFIAGILTVVGYSINDTIVIFDRIRENDRLLNKPQEEIIDMSINQTLSRSIMTTVTTLIIMIPLYIMATSSMREFIVPLMVGIATGCLSSIFLCSPLYYEMSKRSQKSAYEKLIHKNKKKKNKYVGKEKQNKDK